MVSFEHRLKMCQLAFAHLNEVDREKSSQQQNKQTKIDGAEINKSLLALK